MTAPTDTEQRNTQTLHRWYTEMWGQCNAELITELAAPKYLRHDVTGANNLLTSEEYQQMTRAGTAGREVEDFTYYLAAEGDYVGTLGRYIRDGNDQWDWVQLFRLEDGFLCETWLPSMGGNEVRAYANPDLAWAGTELPTESPNPNTPQKTVVRAMFEALCAQQDITQHFSSTVHWHDMLDADARLSPNAVQERLRGWMQNDSATNIQLFLIEQDDVVFAGLHWLLGDDQRSWDWVSAFRLEDNKIAQAWSNGINGSVVPVQQSPDVLWGEDALPAGSTRIGSKI